MFIHTSMPVEIKQKNESASKHSTFGTADEPSWIVTVSAKFVPIP